MMMALLLVASNALATCDVFPTSGSPLPNTLVAGKTYCPDGSTEVFTAPIVVSANNVTVLCTNPTSILQQQTAANNLFTVTGSHNKFIGCNLDGDSVNVTALINVTGATDTVIEGVVCQNYGTGNCILSNGGDQLFINQWNAVAIPGVAIELNSSTSAITNTTIENGYGTLTASSGTTDFIIDANGTSNSISKLSIINNKLLGRNGSGNSDLIRLIGNVTPSIHSVQLTDNTCEATNTLNACFKIFGVDFSVYKGNECRDGGHLMQACLNTGDSWDSAYIGNTALFTTAVESGPGIIGNDDNRDAFIGNVIKNATDGFLGAGSGGIILTTSANPSSRNVVANNSITLDSVASDGILIESTASGKASDDNDVHDNEITGTNTTGQVGILATTSGGGTESNTKIHDNHIYNTKVGVQSDSGTVRTQIIHNIFDTVATTAVVCNGTTPYCDTLDFVVPFTLSGGTITGTLPVMGSVLSGVCEDTTTIANKATIAFTSSTTSATTYTVTGILTDSGICMGQVY